MIQTPNRYAVKDAVIANGASLSGVVDLEWGNVFAIQMPSAWTTANITLQASNAVDGTYADVYDDSGAEVTITAGANRVIVIDANALKIASLRFIKVRSGTTGTAVNQAAERTLKIICKA